METANVIKIFNLIIALITLYPSFGLVKYLIKTRSLETGKKKILNVRLTRVFGIFVGMAILNAILYIISVVGIDGAHEFASVRSTIINFLFAWGVWGLYLFQKKEFER